jgi:uncharacterized protein YprB with RNaseH-like and TPR domain
MQIVASLRDRLKTIQEQKKKEIIKHEKKHESALNPEDCPALTALGWASCGFKVLKREVFKDSPFKPAAALPPEISIIIPDLAGRKLPEYGDFLFFDLETTGLSGGAGTLAFLAAFGRIVKDGAAEKLRITQYLLLDYPGENDFIGAVLKEFTNAGVIVTYNGKCFDSQILKTRCFMNGIKPPEYYHADLLHPARRLWKNIIQDCSQGSIETRILGLDRSGDIPGALAPEIWFEFLKTGSIGRLTGICDHNASDISGLAAVLSEMVMIAKDPFNAKYNYDICRLALYWRVFCRRYEYGDLQITGEKLLLFAARENIKSLPNIKAAVFRALAIDCERKQKNAAQAMEYVKKGLLLTEASENWRNEFERRKERLERKL